MRQQVRSVYHQDTHAAGRAIAEKILDEFPTCPIREVKRLGKTLNQWRTEFLGYFDTDGANNGGTEAMNGLIELHRRIARGFRNRDNYRLRMLLIGGAEFVKVNEASGCQAAAGSAGSAGVAGWLIQAFWGSSRILGSASLPNRSGVAARAAASAADR